MTASIKAILDYLKDNGDVLYHAPIASAFLLCIGFGLGYFWLQKEANLLKLKEENLKLKEENLQKLKKEFSDLQEENKKLKEQQIKPQELILRGELYYKPNEDRPFCPFCYELKDKQTHLLQEMVMQTQDILGKKYICSACNNTYKAPSSHPC